MPVLITSLTNISPVSTIVCSSCGWDLSDDSALASCCITDRGILEQEYIENMKGLNNLPLPADFSDGGQ